MTLSIAEALHQAQEAINGGDYQAAATTCGQLVGQFPAFSAAWRTLGEAHREQGNTVEAQRAYAAALQRNYRNPAIYLGLGLLAEEQGIPENALAFCQVAWELAPQHGYLREPLTRVALRRYGSDGDLQYSRAALAQLHINGHRLRRAAEEYRRALVTLPERIDLKLGLAECLWRMGQDTETAAICRAVLESHPEDGQALVILAEVEHRTGNARKGDELLKRLRAVDPDGALARSMAELNPRADAAWLVVAPQAIPFLSEFLPAAPVERPRIAPAPDFDYQPSRPEIPTPALEDLTPISLEEFGASADDLPLMPVSADLPTFPDMAGVDVSDLDGLGITEEPFTLDAFRLPEDAVGFDAFPETIVPMSAAELDMPTAPAALSFTDALNAETGDDFSFDLPSDPVVSADPFSVGEIPVPVAADVDPATVDVTDLELPAGVPSTGELTPSEAAGLGFEDFSALDDRVVASESAFATMASDRDAADVDHEPSTMDTYLLPANADAAHYSADTFDLSGFADMEVEDETSSQPDFPTMPLESRMQADDLRALSDLASVFDTPLEGDAGAGGGSDTNVTRVLEVAAPPPAPAFPDLDPFDGEITDLTSLAASLEEDIAGALARAGEPIVDEHGTGTGFTTMLASIGAEGLAPFDPRGQESGGFDMSSEMSLSDMGTPPHDEGLSQSPPMDIGQITANWDSIDDELLRATPDAAQHGYTDELRSLDDFDLAPFEVTGEMEHAHDINGMGHLDGITPFDPFGVDSVAGASGHPFLSDDPLTEAAPSASHMTNGVVPGHETFDMAAERMPNELAPIGEDDLLNGLQPFSFDEFDGGAGGPVSGVKPGLNSMLPSAWESGSGQSAIPSDEDLAALLSLGDDLDLDFHLEIDQPSQEMSSLASDASAAADFSLSGSAVDANMGAEQNHAADHSSMTDEDRPGLSPDDAIAVTRRLGMQDVEPQLSSSSSQSQDVPSVFDDVPQRLVPGTELFVRARLVKQDMISDGVISGSRELEGATHVGDATDTRRLPDEDDTFGMSAVMDMDLDDDDEYDDVISSTGATRDTTTLRAALEVTPDDDELRWWLAEALRERGDTDAAYVEYRWIIRNAPERHDMTLRSLQECVDRDQGPEMAHRLIGDIYRRRGDLARASNHATLALQVRRRATVR